MTCELAVLDQLEEDVGLGDTGDGWASTIAKAVATAADSFGKLYAAKQQADASNRLAKTLTKLAKRGKALGMDPNQMAPILAAVTGTTTTTSSPLSRLFGTSSSNGGSSWLLPAAAVAVGAFLLLRRKR